MYIHLKRIGTMDFLRAGSSIEELQSVKKLRHFNLAELMEILFAVRYMTILYIDIIKNTTDNNHSVKHKHRCIFLVSCSPFIINVYSLHINLHFKLPDGSLKITITNNKMYIKKQTNSFYSI